MRLQKYMAHCGVASRRKSEELIVQGKVKVNDVVATTPGFEIDPDVDVVKVKDKALFIHTMVYCMVNKPKGVMSTSEDTHGRKRVIDLIPNHQRLYTVGRLDKETEGLILVTNDGDLTYKLTHPKHEFSKTYHGVVRGFPNEESLKHFRNGIKIEDYKTAPAKIKILRHTKDSTLLEMIIHEGRNRQIRKMCQAIGHPIMELKRVSIGKLTLGNLKLGEWRYLTKDEIDYLKTRSKR
ncbi:MAG: pseudouridine synthase [Eubacteriaceae bacterium]